MPKKRTILEQLTADELRANVKHYDLQVDDRRIKVQLINALAHSRKARLEEVLYALSRPRLKATCRAFDFDDAGRKKADLVPRLVEPAAVSKRHGGGTGRCCMKPLAGEVVWPALLLTLCSQWLQPPDGAR